jgi:hypothetical protein
VIKSVNRYSFNYFGRIQISVRRSGPARYSYSFELLDPDPGSGEKAAFLIFKKLDTPLKILYQDPFMMDTYRYLNLKGRV